MDVAAHVVDVMMDSPALWANASIQPPLVEAHQVALHDRDKVKTREPQGLRS